MVVALCELKEYKTLVEYPYDDLHSDVSIADDAGCAKRN